MQAALMLRSKQRIARNKLRRQRLGIKGDSLPSNVATKEIPPYPAFPPQNWVKPVKSYIFLYFLFGTCK
jgi:hypothetical protein